LIISSLKNLEDNKQIEQITFSIGIKVLTHQQKDSTALRKCAKRTKKKQPIKSASDARA
jgi:hypothetical protein